MTENTITLDVREDIRAGREPFSKIMAAVRKLDASQSLCIVAPFEPVPLFHVLAKEGFRHDSQKTASGEWSVLFTRDGKIPEVTDVAAGSSVTGVPPACDEMIDVDARGLEPPQPMVVILEALASLPPNAGLRARTDRRPMHLYAQLESRGFRGESTEQADGSFITHIRRN